MITVGLVTELRFISKSLRTPVEISLLTVRSKLPIQVNVQDDWLRVYYNGLSIWTESLEDGVSMFGVESCDNLMKIILLMDAGDTDKWRGFAYYEDKLDKK